MKKLIVLSIATFGLLIGNVNAQEKKEKVPHEERMEKKFEKMEAELKLTPDQSAKIRAIHQEAMEKRKALHEQMKQVKEEEKQAIKTILTPEQQKKMQEMREKKQTEHKKEHMHHPQKGEAHGKEGRGKPTPERK